MYCLKTCYSTCISLLFCWFWLLPLSCLILYNIMAVIQSKLKCIKQMLTPALDYDIIASLGPSWPSKEHRIQLLSWKWEKRSILFPKPQTSSSSSFKHWRLILSSARVHQRVVCTVNKVQTVTIFLHNKGPDEQFITQAAAAGLKNKEEDRFFIRRKLDIKALWAYCVAS